MSVWPEDDFKEYDPANLVRPDPSFYDCPVCGGAANVPCPDVIEQALLALLYAEREPSPLSRLVAAQQMPLDPALAVPLLVAQAAWPTVFADAKERTASHLCDEVLECDDCLMRVCVLQIEDWHWVVLENSVANL